MLLKDYCMKGYTKHVRFLIDKSRVYAGAALVCYDQAAREKAELLGPDSFMYGDHELYHIYLGLEHLKPKGKVFGAGGGVASVGGSTKGSQLKKTGVCWRYNENRSYKKEPCPWKHECGSCAGLHRTIECDK